MSKVQFGLVLRTEALNKAKQHFYVKDVHRLLRAVKGHYNSAWLIDPLQFEDSGVLEGWTALTYLLAP